jgi:hypothetical protein
MKYQILKNGNLEITGAVGEYEFPESDAAMFDAFEPLISNGLTWVDPAEIGALTSAPILTDASREDDGSLRLDGANVWWFPDYALRSPLEDLIKKGRTIFKKAEPV